LNRRCDGTRLAVSTCREQGSALFQIAEPMTPRSEVKIMRRIQESMLAPVERKVLLWLAARLPGWIHPDHLTIMGLGSMLLAGLFYFLCRWNPWCLFAVNICIAANWFGDSLDGTLARYRNRQRPRYGYYVDHITDSLGSLFLFMGLGLSGYMSERPAFALLTAYLLLSIESYLVACTLDEFRISFWKFSPTELRLLLMVGNTCLFVRPKVMVLGHSFLLFDIGGTIAVILMASVMAVSMIRHTRRLYSLERV
jgi:archaetidylinositol phosphate synthase